MAETSRADEVRSRIASEAMRLFAAKGFEGTSVQQIADAAGISKQLLLYHYSSKRELYDHIVVQVTDTWKGFLPEIGQAAGTDEFGAIVVKLQGFLVENPHFGRFVMRGLISPAEGLTPGLIPAVQPWMDAAAGDMNLPDSSDPIAFLALIGLILVAIDAIAEVEGAVIPKDRLFAEAGRLIRQSMGF